MPGKFLAEFELYLMLAITRLGPRAYGAEIRRVIEDRTGRPVSVGAMYLTLARLSDKGLAAHTVSQPTPEKGGRARKHYRLTPAGRSGQGANDECEGHDQACLSHGWSFHGEIWWVWIPGLFGAGTFTRAGLAVQPWGTDSPSTPRRWWHRAPALVEPGFFR